MAHVYYFRTFFDLGLKYTFVLKSVGFFELFLLTSCVQSISKWWFLDTVFVFFRCKCRNCIVASLQNIGERYCCSKLDFAVSYSSRSEGHNYHILWWYFELQMDRIHINHLRSLVAADPTFRLTAAFTVCKKYFLFKIIEQERKLIYQGKQHLLSKISHHSSVSLGMRNEKWENDHYF